MSNETDLGGTPYLIETDSESQSRFDAARGRADKTRELAVAATKSMRRRAQHLLAPYAQATRADIVRESNEIEGYVWDPSEVRRAIDENVALFDSADYAMTEVVQSDPKLYQVLGLYKAHQLAETWDDSLGSPKSVHIRQFHRLILGAVPGSGSYKEYPNQISGREGRHATTLPIDVPRAINELADWWADVEGDPLLIATVVHAWLAHIHPFSDGNGRLARVLANLELMRYGYAPLILASESDRGEYYGALQESDDGNILPLYELFERVVRRQTLLMSRSGYLEEVLNNRLLGDHQARFNLWSAGLAAFTRRLSEEVSARGWALKREGELGLKLFSLLWNQNQYGNGWYVTVGAPGEKKEWLLWFGFKTEEWVVKGDSSSKFPSIHISRRNHLDGAPHPFQWKFPYTDGVQDVPDEIRLVPLNENAVKFRFGQKVIEQTAEIAASDLATALVAAGQRADR